MNKNNYKIIHIIFMIKSISFKEKNIHKRGIKDNNNFESMDLSFLTNSSLYKI